MSDCPHPRWLARVPSAALQACCFPMDRAVLVTIALYADANGAVRIDLPRVARELDVSLSTVKRSMRRLRAAGSLTTTPGTGRAVSIHRLSTGTVVGSLVTPQGGHRANVVGSLVTPVTEEHQRAGSQCALPAECEHGDPYGGARCIDCRQEATA